METLLPLASALGLGVLAGARLYATVLAIGLLLRYDWVTLPAEWQQASVLADGRVLIAAAVACAIEFVADKIPWLDSLWDSFHTFVRPIGAALAATSLFTNLEPAYQVLLFLVAGSAALSGHSVKAATRLVVNHSPEPFTNIVLSLAEDAFVAGGLYLLVAHPWLMAGIAVTLLALGAWLAPRVYRALRASGIALAALLRSWFGTPREPQLTPAQRQWLAENHPGQAPSRLFTAISTRDLKSLRRNTPGTLCLIGAGAVFFPRKWGKRAPVQIGPLSGVATRERILLDELTLLAPSRVRFDLPAGQIAAARQAAGRYSSASV